MASVEERIVEIVLHGERKHPDGQLSPSDIMRLLTTEERLNFGPADAPRAVRGTMLLSTLWSMTERGQLPPPARVKRGFVQKHVDPLVFDNKLSGTFAGRTGWYEAWGW